MLSSIYKGFKNIMYTQNLGKFGEKYAEAFLISGNYLIFKKNFYSKYGEIDIVAQDQNTNEIVFVEVKTRTSDNFGAPEEAITFQKKQKIIATALYFINSSIKKYPLIWRIDLIAVKLDTQHQLKEINHLKNIFNGI